jgi:hypothetical protein
MRALLPAFRLLCVCECRQLSVGLLLQFLDAIETGVARAAAMASSMSAEALAAMLAERKQRTLQPSVAGPDAGAGEAVKGHSAPGTLSPKGPISRRFPAFAQRTRSRTQSEGAEAPKMEASAPDTTDHNTADTRLAEDVPPAATNLQPVPLSKCLDVADVPKRSCVKADSACTITLAPTVQRGVDDTVDMGAGSDSSCGSSFALLQSPSKKTRQIHAASSGRQATKAKQDVCQSLTAGLDIAILSAMAVPRAAPASPVPTLPEGAFKSKASQKGSAGRSLSKSRRHAKPSSGSHSRRARAESLLRMDVSFSGGSASSCPGQLAAAGSHFARALFDSDASRYVTHVMDPQMPCCSDLPG